MKFPIRIPIKILECPLNPYGYVYLTVDTVRGYKYIGKHKSSVFDTKYFGSNAIIQQIVKKRPETLYCMILEWVISEEQLNEREKFWIAYFDAVNSPYFYNVLAGGDGGALTGESLERMRQSRMGKCSGPDHWAYGTHKTDDHKRYLSQINSGENNPVRKSVYAFNLDRILVGTYPTRVQAASAFGLTASKVSALCNKNQRNQDITTFCKGIVFADTACYSFKAILEESKVTVPGEKRHLTQIHKDKISQKSKLFRHTDSSKERLRQSHLGLTHTDASKARISQNRRGKCVGKDNPNYGGKAMTPEHYKAHSEFMKGKHMSPATEFTSENCSGGNNSQARAVVQLTSDYQLVREFSYLGEVSKVCPEFPSSEGVRNCCKGRQQKYEGYRWMYKDDYLRLLQPSPVVRTPITNSASQDTPTT